MSAVSISNVSKSFGRTAVLNDINLQIEAGSFVTLLGPSGCGKTTLLRIVAGLERPDTGTIAAQDVTFVDVERGIFAPPQDRKLGYVFQDYGLWPHMSVFANVAFPLQMARRGRAEIATRVGEVLEQVRLSDHAQKLPEQLSGGQKQRVSIARALAGYPDIILFDEPLSNLDANLREELGREIRLLSKQLGLTCINVTHDRREAQILSDHVALMKDGVFHQLGQPEELFRAPRDEWAARFLDAGNILPADLIRQSGQPNGAVVLVPRSSIQIANGEADLRGRVLNATYIDNRFEATVDVAGHRLNFYCDQALQPNADVTLAIAHDEVRALVS